MWLEVVGGTSESGWKGVGDVLEGGSGAKLMNEEEGRMEVARSCGWGKLNWTKGIADVVEGVRG